WEAERGGRTGCLAVQNFTQPGTLNLQEQVCRTCNMRAYAGVVVVELPRRNNQRQLDDLKAMIELANGYLSRLFKVDHYYNRMREEAACRRGRRRESTATPSGAGWRQECAMFPASAVPSRKSGPTLSACPKPRNSCVRTATGSTW